MTPALLKASHEQWPRRTVAKVEITLPVPVSTNALYRNRTKRELGIAKNAGHPLPGRAKTERYRTWLRTAGNMVMEQRPGRVEGPFALTIVLPETARLDTDNIKCVPDLLQQYGIIENDRLAASVFISRSSTVQPTECLVTVTPALVAARAAA